MITEFERHQGNDLLFVQLQHCKEVECKHLMATYTTKRIYITDGRIHNEAVTKAHGFTVLIRQCYA